MKALLILVAMALSLTSHAQFFNDFDSDYPYQERWQVKVTKKGETGMLPPSWEENLRDVGAFWVYLPNADQFIYLTDDDYDEAYRIALMTFGIIPGEHFADFSRLPVDVGLYDYDAVRFAVLSGAWEVSIGKMYYDARVVMLGYSREGGLKIWIDGTRQRLSDTFGE